MFFFFNDSARVVIRAIDRKSKEHKRNKQEGRRTALPVRSGTTDCGYCDILVLFVRLSINCKARRRLGNLQKNEDASNGLMVVVHRVTPPSAMATSRFEA